MDVRPRLHPGDVAMADGASLVEAMQSQLFLTHRMLVEVLERAGGEARLAPGFEDRVSDDSVTCITHFDEDTGEYVVRVAPTPDAYRSGARTTGPGAGVAPGSTWRQRRGDDRAESPRFEVESVVGDTAVLIEEGTRLELRVKKITLLIGADGWTRA